MPDFLYLADNKNEAWPFYNHVLLLLLLLMLLILKTSLKCGEHSEVNKVNGISHESKEAPGLSILNCAQQGGGTGPMSRFPNGWMTRVCL